MIVRGHKETLEVVLRDDMVARETIQLRVIHVGKKRVELLRGLEGTWNENERFHLIQHTFQSGCCIQTEVLKGNTLIKLEDEFAIVWFVREDSDEFLDGIQYRPAIISLPLV